MSVSPWHYLADHDTWGYRYHLSDSAQPAARAQHHRDNLHILLDAYALAQLLCSSVLGAPSDHFERRPMLLASLIGGAAINSAVMAIAPTL
jgi:MFS family permease